MVIIMYGFQVSTTCKMDIIYLSYVEFPKFLSHNYLLVKERGLPSWVINAPRLVPEVSNSSTKGLVKFGTVRIGVEHKAFFKDLKAFSTISSREK